MTPKTPTGDPTQQPGKLSKTQRQSAAREKATQMRLEAESKARRQKGLIIGLTVAVALALIVGVVIAVQSARNQTSENAEGPAGLSDVGGVVVGPDDSDVTVSVYLDFICPACKAFETESGAALTELAEKGEIKLEYVPVAILDDASSGTKYSTRAASAAYCVAEHDPDAFEPYLKALYDNQPEEGGSGLADEVIAQIAELAGASDASTQCIEDGTYADFVAKVTDDASAAGLPGTPWVRVNGTTVENPSKQGLEDAINAARGGEGEG